MSWYYEISDRQHGPFSDEELTTRYMRGEFAEHNNVWTEGLN